MRVSKNRCCRDVPPLYVCVESVVKDGITRGVLVFSDKHPSMPPLSDYDLSSLIAAQVPLTVVNSYVLDGDDARASSILSENDIDVLQLNNSENEN